MRIKTIVKDGIEKSLKLRNMQTNKKTGLMGNAGK